MTAGALSPPSQLLARHLPALRARGPLLLLNPPGDGVLPLLAGSCERPLIALNQRCSDHRAVAASLAAPHQARFGALHEGPPVPEACVFLPREKALARLLLHDAAAALEPGGRLWAVGENRAGARSSGRGLVELCPDGALADTARRCSLFRGHCAHPPARPRLEDFLTWHELRLGDGPAPVASGPGVFSHGRLDEGTALLLEHLPPLDGRILDFGCGSGIIGLAAALSRPAARLTLLDDFALALAAAAATLERNGVAAERILASDGFSALAPDPPFDWIVSNPPFHRGRHTHYGIGEALIDQAPEYLAPGGALLIVGNRFLGYGRRMAQRFGAVERLAEAPGFHVHLARRAPRSGSS